MLVKMDGQHVENLKGGVRMQCLTDFTWEIAGTSDGRIPTTPEALGEVELTLYDSGYTYDALLRAIKKDAQAPEELSRNFRKVLTGENKHWKLWLVTIKVDRIAFDFYQTEKTSLYHLEVVSPKMLGLRFITHLSIGGREVMREATCVMWGDARSGSCRTQVEEFQNGHMTASFSLYHGGTGATHKK